MMDSTKLRLYTLKTMFDNGESIIGFYAFQDKKLYRVFFMNTTIENKKHWFHKFHLSCSIDSLGTLLEEFREKDEIFRKQKLLHDLYRFDEIEILAGKYFPRIYRPILQNSDNLFLLTPETRVEQLRIELNLVSDFLPVDIEQALESVTQLSSLIEGLKSICRTIHPVISNMKVFGSEIRNLLILSCTEVEAQLKGIYEANSAQVGKYLTTADYYKLNEPLKLNQYKVNYSIYPWLESFSPFSGWSAPPNTTKSLPWYDGYNAVKHNREREFEKGNLLFLLNSIAAIAILLRAQHGPNIPFWTELIGQFFSFSQVPEWKHVEKYFPPYEDSSWQAEQFFKV